MLPPPLPPPPVMPLEQRFINLAFIISGKHHTFFSLGVKPPDTSEHSGGNCMKPGNYADRASFDCRSAAENWHAFNQKVPQEQSRITKKA